MSYNCIYNFIQKKMTTITIRTNDELKTKAKEVANQMGLSISSLINWLLKKVVRERKVEFTALTENWYTEEYEDEILEVIKNKDKKLRTTCETAEDTEKFLKSLMN